MNALNGKFHACGLEVIGGADFYRGRDPQGQYFQSDWVPLSALSADNLPCPMVPSQVYPLDYIHAYDLKQAETEAPTDVWTILHGYHELEPGQLRSPGYPDQWTEFPYTHRLRVSLPATVGAATYRTRVPIFLPFDNLWAVRSLVATNITGSPIDLRAQLFDANGQAFSNIPVPWRALFSTLPQTPVTPSPEILVPAGQSMALDLSKFLTDDPCVIEFAIGGALINAK